MYIYSRLLETVEIHLFFSLFFAGLHTYIYIIFKRICVVEC